MGEIRWPFRVKSQNVKAQPERSKKDARKEIFQTTVHRLGQSPPHRGASLKPSGLSPSCENRGSIQYLLSDKSSTYNKGPLYRRHQGEEKPNNIDALSSWMICICVWAKWLLPPEKQQQCELTSHAAPSSHHLPTLQPPPNPASALPRGQGPCHATATPGAPQKAGRCPLAKTAPENDGFCKNQLLFLMGLFHDSSAITYAAPWLKL